MTPAHAITEAHRGHRCRIVAPSSVRPARSATSCSKYVSFGWSANSSGSGFRSMTTTESPRSSSRLAVARPTPRAPPVMTWGTSAEAVVDSGRGIRGDRVAAFTNGSLNVPADQWQRYSAFTAGPRRGSRRGRR
ncbi:hypothetical protein DN540_36335 [Burkholderia multivorans]|nr:hypothetical protein DN540_36335 [Burkholderia multivorans]